MNDSNRQTEPEDIASEGEIRLFDHARTRPATWSFSSCGEVPEGRDGFKISFSKWDIWVQSLRLKI